MSLKLQTGISAFVALLGLLALSHAVSFEVKNGNSTCIKAELSANFSITYVISNGTNTVNVPLPASAVVGNDSSCGSSGVSPQLVVTFGDGHAMSLIFSTDSSQYQVTNLSMSYNLSDSTTFPQATTKGVSTSATNTSGISAHRNTTYRCLSSNSVHLGGNTVIIIFSNIRMEAYMTSANLSSNETVCTADLPVTTVAPTQSAPTTPPPTPAQKPESGNYNITNNGTACLLANMGLQLNVTYLPKGQNKTVQRLLNLQPNMTSASGSCENTTATLMLGYDAINISFIFTLNTTSKKYHLSTLNMTASWPDLTAPLIVGNSSLNYLQGTLGHSYMCSAEQTLSVVNDFSINTFKLQVQPFGVSDNKFGAADKCELDKENMLIPIIVGAALAGLVLIVLIAYLVGRKRSHAGYQTI